MYNPAKRFNRISHYVYGALLEDWAEEKIYRGILEHFPDSAPAKSLSSFGNAMAWYRTQFKKMHLGHGDLDAFVIDNIITGASDQEIQTLLEEQFPYSAKIDLPTFRNQLRERLINQQSFTNKNNPKRRSQMFKTTASKRYDNQYWVYWWDLHDGDVRRLSEGQPIRFMRKDDMRKATVAPDELLPYLVDETRTSRGNGNWGIRALRERPQDLRIEIPGAPHDDWPTISVNWEVER